MNFALIEPPDTGRQKQVVQGYYRQQACRTAHGQLDANAVGQDADKENTHHGDAPVHHVYTHDPPLMSIIGVGQQQGVAQGQPAGLPQPHGDKNEQRQQVGTGSAEGHKGDGR